MVQGVFYHYTRRLMAQLQLDKLINSRFNKPKYLEAFSKRFDSGLKKIFPVSNSRDDQFVQIGTPDKNDSSCEISRGRLRLTG